MVLGKLPVTGRPTNLDNSMARAYCACSRCWWGLFGQFFPKQLTNQPYARKEQSGLITFGLRR